MYVFVYDNQYRGCTGGLKKAQNPAFSPFWGILSLSSTLCIRSILSIINNYIHNMLQIDGIPYPMNNLGLKLRFKWENQIFPFFRHFPYISYQNVWKPTGGRQAMQIWSKNSEKNRIVFGLVVTSTGGNLQPEPRCHLKKKCYYE